MSARVGSWGAPAQAWLGRALPFWDQSSGPEMLLSLLLVAAPLAIGGVHLPSQIALASVAVLGFVWVASRRRVARQRIRVGWIGLALFVAVAWSFLQWIPLPAGLVEVLSPGSAEARTLAAQALGVAAPEWFPISLDGGRTAAAWLTLLGVLATYLLAANLRPDSGIKDRLIVYVEIAALAVLVVGVVHSVLGLERIYGFYGASVDIGGRFLMTPFVNPNHAAALFLLGAVVAFGAWLAAQRDARWHLASGVALSMGVIATLSRANTLLLLAGLLLIGLAAWRSRAQPELRHRFPRLLLGVACFAFVTVIIMGPDAWLAEFSGLADMESQRNGLIGHCWAVGAQLTGQYSVTGTGLGAFGVAATAAMPDWSTGLVSYAHNGVLQSTAELGLPIAIIVMLAFAFGFLRVLPAATRNIGRFAAAVAILVVLVQNQVDFSLYLPGVALPFAAVLGWLVGDVWGRDERSTRKKRRGDLYLRWHSPYTIAAFGALLVTSMHAWSEQPQQVHGELAAGLTTNKPGSVALDELLVAHPADFHAFRMAALVAARMGEPHRAARLTARAFALAPTEPDVLASHVRARLAVDDGNLVETLRRLDQLAAHGPEGLDQAIAIVLGQPERTALLEQFFGQSAERTAQGAATLMAAGKSAAAQQLLAWGIARYPDGLPLYETLGSLWLKTHATNELDALSIKLLGRAAGVRDAAPRAPTDPAPDTVELDPDWARAGYQLQAHVLSKRGEMLPAWHLFIEAADLVPERSVEPLLAAGRIAAQALRIDLVEDVLQRLDGQHLVRNWPRGERHRLRSYVREAKGDLRGAIREMHHAHRYLGHVSSFRRRQAELFDLVDEPRASARERAEADRLDAAAAATAASTLKLATPKTEPAPQ